MMIFDLLKHPSKKSQEYVFTQAGGFRGFKSYPIVVYGDKESERNNELLKDIDMTSKQITFKVGKSPSYEKPFLLVFIDNKKIGAIFDGKQVRAMTSGSIESVYVKFEPENIVGKDGVITRHRARLFVKYCV